MFSLFYFPYTVKTFSNTYTCAVFVSGISNSDFFLEFHFASLTFSHDDNHDFCLFETNVFYFHLARFYYKYYFEIFGNESVRGALKMRIINLLVVRK